METILQLNPYIAVGVVSMLPLFEVRGAIPLGIAGYGLHPLVVILVSVIASLVPVVFLLLFLEKVTGWLRSLHPRIDDFFAWLFKRTYHKHSLRFERWGSLALMLFVGIPMPFTGAWTGALLAYLFGFKFHYAMLFIAVGSLLAAIIVAAASLGGLAALSL